MRLNKRLDAIEDTFPKVAKLSPQEQEESEAFNRSCAMVYESLSPRYQEIFDAESESGDKFKGPLHLGAWKLAKNHEEHPARPLTMPDKLADWLLTLKHLRGEDLVEIGLAMKLECKRCGLNLPTDYLNSGHKHYEYPKISFFDVCPACGGSEIDDEWIRPFGGKLTG
ncbi:MAG: hypothetical protein HQK86_11945 [Nitrospinae bacterium]|nr:hypothetical protein [Nitrospinota bacterium]MBF0633548.1 hypothetical protein [Nitrospinota bacterium]